MKKISGIFIALALLVGVSAFAVGNYISGINSRIQWATAFQNDSNSCTCPQKPKVFVIGGIGSQDNDIPRTNPYNKGSEINRWFIDNYVSTNKADPVGYIGMQFSGDLNQNTKRVNDIASQIANYITTTGNQVDIVSYSWGAESTPAIYQAIQKILGTTKAANCIKHQVLLDPPIASGPVSSCLVHIGSACYPAIFQSMLNAEPYIAGNPETVYTSKTVASVGFDFSSDATMIPGNFVEHYPFEPAQNGNPVAKAAVAKFKAGVDKALAQQCTMGPRDFCPNLTKAGRGGLYSYMMDSLGNTLDGTPGSYCFWKNQVMSGDAICRSLSSGRNVTLHQIVQADWPACRSTVSQATANQCALNILKANLAAVAAKSCGSSAKPVITTNPPTSPTPPAFPSPSPSPTSIPSPKPSVSPSPIPTPSVSPSPSPSISPSPTPIASVSPTPTPSPSSPVAGSVASLTIHVTPAVAGIPVWIWSPSLNTPSLYQNTDSNGNAIFTQTYLNNVDTGAHFTSGDTWDVSFIDSWNSGVLDYMPMKTATLSPGLNTVSLPLSSVPNGSSYPSFSSVANMSVPGCALYNISPQNYGYVTWSKGNVIQCVYYDPSWAGQKNVYYNCGDPSAKNYMGSLSSSQVCNTTSSYNGCKSLCTY